MTPMTLRQISDRRLAALLVLAVFAPFVHVSSVHAQENAAAKAPVPPALRALADLEDRESQVQPLLEELTHKFGPRLTSSTALTKACEWARDKFASYGLEASLVQWGEFAVGFDRGKLEGKILAPVERALELGTNAWTPGTNGPVAGRAVALPESAEAVDKSPESFKGAYVFVPRGKRLGAPNEGTVERALETAGITAYVSTRGGELIQTDGTPPSSFDKLPKRVTIMLQGKAHKEILDWIGEGKEVKLEFNIENKFVKGPIPLYNVVADLRGSELPNEYVIVGGHIDSWDGAQGATDNGTGVASTLEAARILTKSGVKPKRTIRFMLWSGEEQGLLGSRAWIKANPDVLPNISAVLVHDEGTNYAGAINVPKLMRPVLEPALEPLTRLGSPFPFELRHVENLPQGIGSDHDAFLAVGVPGFFWVQRGDVDYDRGHHTQYDTLDIVRHDYQRHTVKIAAGTALTIANLAQKLPRPRRLGFIPADAPNGIGVDDVTPDGVGAKAGLKKGDVIVKIADSAVTSVAELRAAIAQAPSKASVIVMRDGKQVVLSAEFPESRPGGRRPESAPAR
jgi:hypothetical protein